MKATPPVLSIEGVSRSFGPLLALDQVDLHLYPGEIHALVGENGAGKSTLVKVLAGALTPDAGRILVDGESATFASRSDSLRAGVGAVFQHFSLVEAFTVAENSQLGRPESGRMLRLGEARRLVRSWADKAGVDVDPDARVADLSVPQRQRVEFVLALAWGARVLLLDEPTAVLSPTEASRLLNLVRDVTGHGVAVLLVTHKLREVEAVADRVTVLRRGVVTGRHRATEMQSRQVLVTEMMGSDRLTAAPTPVPRSELRLEIHDLTVGRLRGVTLRVRAGEIVGLAGVVGSGQTDLIRAVAGLASPSRGKIMVDGVDVTGDASAACRTGVGYLPEDRAVDGLALNLPVWVNAVAKRLREMGMLQRLDEEAVGRLTRQTTELLDVTPADPGLRTGDLSGGNQQRLVAGRELLGSPAVVAAAEPTRGLDPVARVEVANALKQAAADGTAVLVTSTDIDELVEVAGRIVVLSGGDITYDAPSDQANRTSIGTAMAGVA